MTQHARRSAGRSSVRSLPGAAALALVFGLAVMAPDVAPSILASPEEAAFSRLVTPDDLAMASRGKPAAVAAPVEITDEFAAEVIRLTNVERAAAGLPELIHHPNLSVAAATHANDQRNAPCEVGFLTHTGSDGSRAGDRILRTGLDIKRWAENVACAHPSAKSVVRGWMKSPGHRDNILSPRLTHIGAAMATSDTGQMYWVQVFGTPR